MRSSAIGWRINSLWNVPSSSGVPAIRMRVCS